jgi:26S proteasome regulatory subunit T6
VRDVRVTSGVMRDRVSCRHNNIKILMATNRIDILDPALLRPGRIDRKIEFPNPGEIGRLDILRIHSRRMNLTRGISLQKVCERLQGAR